MEPDARGTARRAARLCIGLLLGISYVFYGAVKLLGGQFNYGEWVLDSRSVEGPTLVWAFYGWSPIYGRFIGLTELVVGLLLLVPRTRTLGALALLPVAVNITVLDFCFGFPGVKYMVLGHLVLCLVLLGTDRGRLAALFAREERPRSAARLPRGLKWTIGVLAGLLTLFFANVVLVAVTPGPAAAARELCVREGHPTEALELVRTRMEGAAGIGMTGVVELRVREAEPPRTLRVSVRRACGLVPWRALEVRATSTPEGE